jgi:hypothetical protein
MGKVFAAMARSRQEDVIVEQLRLEGGQLLDTIKQLLNEGNVRRIVVKQGEQTIVEFPLTVGVVGAALAPALAAAGAIAALITDCTIEIERASPDDESGAGASDPDPVALGDSTPETTPGPTLD